MDGYLGGGGAGVGFTPWKVGGNNVWLCSQSYFEILQFTVLVKVVKVTF